jgi:hypothetical protein
VNESVIRLQVDHEGDGINEGETDVIVDAEGADPAVNRVEGASKTKL